jgi:hypothetical protein
LANEDNIATNADNNNSRTADDEYSEGDEILSNVSENAENVVEQASDPVEDAQEDDGHSDSDHSNQNDANPVNLPNVGARITFRNPDSNLLVNATVTRMHRTMQFQWPGWRNIKIDGAQCESSVNLDEISHGCIAWRYLDDGPRVPRAPGDGYIPQIDGNYTLPTGPSYKDYAEPFTDSDLGDFNGQNYNQVFFVPPFQPRVQAPPPTGMSRLRHFLSRITRQAWSPFRRR